MVRRIFVLLPLLASVLGGCANMAPSYPTAGGAGAAGPVIAPASRRIALLAPMSGPRAEVGQALQRAAQLALEEPGGPPLDTRDTGGTAEGAAQAARAAVAAQAGLIIGPLSAAETAAVAPIAREAGIAVLAFTNDPAQAQPGVWTLGVTPAQQVRRLAGALQAQGKSRMAGLLPDSDFGRAMGEGLNQAAGSLGMQVADLRFHARGTNAINQGVRAISSYASRRGPLEAQIRAARARGDADGRREAAELSRRSIAPPPFDALLLADTGDSLAEIATFLPYYDLDRGVQIIGPLLWASPDSGSGAVSGAWFAAPDPATRANFEERFTQKFGDPPPRVADLAYDAASLARVLAPGPGYAIGALTRPEGFAGASGIMALQPDGRVRRSLAIYKVQRGGPQVIEPAPQSISAPGV